VLAEIGADEMPRLLVLGKIDLLAADERQALVNRHPGAVLVSAVTGEGLDELVHRIEEEFTKSLVEVELLIPFRDGGRLAELHQMAGDLIREDTPEGYHVTVRLPRPVADRYSAYALTNTSS
jgi:GTP-binding protein HflX